MNEKQEILTLLKQEFEHWQDLLASLSEEQITSSRLPNGWTIKDVMAHLMAWQQVSIARLEAAKAREEPVLPDWLASSDPESEEERDLFNARITARYKEQPWPRVHQAWRNGFLHFLVLAEDVPQDDLIDAGNTRS